MFCKKCGAQIADGQLFCGECGAEVLKNENAEQEPVEQTEGQQPPMDTHNSLQPDPAMFAEKKKIKRSKKPVVFAILAVVAVLVVAAILCIPMIKRALMSEQEVMASYDRDIIEDSLEALSSSFKAVGEDTKYSGNIDIIFSDYLAGQISTYIGDISSAKIGFDIATEGQQYGGRLNLSLSDTEIISFDVMLDIENAKAYISVPGLIDGALELDVGMLMPEDGKASVSSLMENISSLEISDAVIKDVLAIIDAAYGAAGDATKSQDALTIDGVSQNCTVYTLTIDEENAAKMVIAALQQLKKSENIKNFAGELVEDYYAELTREEIISEIDVFCDSGIESLTDEDLTFDSDEVIVYNMYVSDDDVIGRSFEVNGVKIVAACVENGRDKAFEYSIHQELEGSVKFSGKGTDGGDGFTGEATLAALENEVVILSFDKFICDDDNLSGTVEITLGDGINEIDPYNEGLSVLSTMRVIIDFGATDETGKVTAGLSLMNFDLGEIVFESAPDSDYSPSMPEKVAFSDPNTFRGSINFVALFARLAKAGFDIRGLMGGMRG